MILLISKLSIFLGMGRFMALPEKNKHYIVEINDMTHEGQGVGRIDGFAVFVNGALTGELVETRIIKVSRAYAVGKLIDILKPSPDRAEPFCSVFKRCGGCSLQHMNYEATLRLKTKLVKDNIERIGGLKDVTVFDTIGMENPFNYRNKAQYPVAVAKGEVISGFYAPRSHEVIKSEVCGIQNPASDRLRNEIIRFITEKGLTVYDESTGKGLVRHIVTRVGFNTGDVMVVIVINGKRLPHADELVNRLTQMDLGNGDVSSENAKSALQLKSIYLNINDKKTNVILGDKNILLYGSSTISDTIGKYRFLVSPHSFFQVNPVQTEVLYNKALEYAQLTGKETVFDLYCGTGTISLFLSEKAAKVYGVEVVEAAVEDAKKNASLNGVGNAEFIQGEAEKVVPVLYREGVRADVVVLDPPRKGCDEKLLHLISEMGPERIVYVSCNPSTLARDLKYLAGSGYRVEKVQPVDMFPWSGGVESVTLLQAV